MFCKWCGMESDTSDVCSWCRHPFPAATVPQSGTTTATMGADGRAPVTTAPPGPAVYDDLDDDLSLSPFGGSYLPERPARAAPEPRPGPVDLDDFEPPVAPREQARPAPPAPARPVAPSMPAAPPPAAARPTPPPTAPAYVEPTPAQETVVAPPVPAVPSVAPPIVPAPSTPSAPTPVSPGRGGPGYTPVAQRPPSDRPELQAIPIRRTPGPPPGVIPIARAPQPPAPEPTAPTPPQAVPPPAAPSLPLAGIRQPVAPPEPQPLDVPLHVDVPGQGGNGTAPVEELELPPLEEPPVDEPQIGVRIGQRPPAAPVTPPGLPRPGASTRQTDRSVRPPARTWYCRWCGMESENADTCTWCRRDLRNMPAPGAQHHVTMTRPGGRKPVAKGPIRPVVPASPRPAAPTPAAVPKAAAPPPPAAPARPEAQGVPKLGMFQAQKSKYYTDKVFDPVSQAHYDADTGEAETPATAAIPLRPPLPDETSDHMRLVGIYSAIVVAIVSVVGVVLALTSGASGNNALAIAVAAFLAGLAMPLVRLFPYGEDEAEDVVIAAVLALLLGPLAGAGAYAILWMYRQDGSPAIAAVFIAHLVIRITLDLVAGIGFPALFTQMTPFAFTSATGGVVVGIVKQCLPIAGLVGWFMASMARKFDD